MLIGSFAVTSFTGTPKTLVLSSGTRGLVD